MGFEFAEGKGKFKSLEFATRPSTTKAREPQCRRGLNVHRSCNDLNCGDQSINRHRRLSDGWVSVVQIAHERIREGQA